MILSRFLLKILTLGIFLGCFFVDAKAQAKAPVFLYAGQSNADGREYVSNLPDYMKVGSSPYSPYTYLRWASICGNPSQKVFGTRSMALGERYAFCDVTNYWIDQAVKQNFYAIKCAYGGTAIAPGVTAAKLPVWYADADWMQTHYAYKGDDITKAEYANYNSLTKNLTEGFASLVDGTLAALDEGYDVKAILWHQGESDRNASGAYYTNFKTMIAFMRNAIYQKTGDEADLTLPFIFGTVCRRSTQYNAEVEAAHKQVAAEDPNCYVIDMKNATLLSDNLHFDRQATEYLGKKMYNLIVELGLISGPQVDVEEFAVEESPMDDVVVPSPDNRQWDFTVWSQATNDSLAADVALASGSKWNSHNYGYRRSSGINEEQLFALNNYVIPETEGLFFSSPQGNRIAINTAKKWLVFVTGDPTVFIPKLKAGQLVTFTLASAKETIRVKTCMDSEGLADVVGTDVVGTSGGTVTFRVRHDVTLPTHIGFQTSGAAYLKKIEVKTPETVNVLIGADRMETFASDRALDFSPFEALFKAYIVSGVDDANVLIEQVKQVPAGTGVVLIGEECTVDVPVVQGETEPLPADNLLTAVVGAGVAPAGSFTLATSHGNTLFTKTEAEQPMENQAYLLLPDAARSSYGLQVYVRQEQLPVPSAAVFFKDGDNGLKTAGCTLKASYSGLKVQPEKVVFCYRGANDAEWTAMEGDTFNPPGQSVYQFKVVADGYTDSEPTEGISLAPCYALQKDVDLTSFDIYANAVSGTGAFAWGWASLPSGQEYGKLAAYNAIPGLIVQNSKLAARYSYAKGVGLANNYGYTMTTDEGSAYAFAEYVFYQSASLTSFDIKWVHNPVGVNLTFPNYKTGALKALRIYEPADVTPLSPADVNGDGNVDVSDILAIIGFMGSVSPSVSSQQADANGDGNVDWDDILCVINTAAQASK